MSTLAARSPWYCIALRRTGAMLRLAARRLEAPALGTATPPPSDALHVPGRGIEERLQEVRLRCVRYY
jgi:hypothetical protein